MLAANSILKCVCVVILFLTVNSRVEANYYDEAANEAALTEKFESYKQNIQKLDDEITRLRQSLAETPSNKSISISRIQ
jgi:uncharacterized protein YlxW (UPF0749 family)